MKSPPHRTDEVRAALRRSGNPYYSLQIHDEGGHPDAEHSTADERKRHIRRLQDPYAALASDSELGIGAADTRPSELPSEEGRGATPNPTRLPTISKAAFRERCRSIFKQYMPDAERSSGRLRQHYRDFIARNEARNPAERSLVLQNLQKYDLSAIPGLSTQFNRERDPLTEEKLRQIERVVAD